MSPSATPTSTLARLTPFLLLALGGTFYFLGFPGFDLFPFAFVALVPLIVVLERERASSLKRVALLGLFYGFIEFTGGYYWIVEFLATWSGFGHLPSFLIASLFFAALSLSQVTFACLYVTARRKGWGIVPVVVALVVALEYAFPVIFPAYLGNSLHAVPLLVQTADLAGPSTVSVMIALVNAALAETILTRRQGRPLPVRSIAAAVLVFLATAAYGAYRIHEVDARAASARKLRVAMVQVNMGTYAKREDPAEGFRRHLAQSREIERDGRPDLLVWPESAYTFFVPDRPNVRDYVSGDIRSPLLFGGLARRRVNGEWREFNTAFLLDELGNVRGTYDKTFLIPFGEYIPFGDVFPSLYSLSPNTGRFAAGTHQRVMELGDVRITTIICYEDVLPNFTRQAVRRGDPHLIVNLTNDAWYGDTHEPWIHLALAKFRAIETHRALVRSTNSGVSAFVDPVGRVIDHTGVFERANLEAELPLLTGHTLFEYVGTHPSLLAVLAVLVFVRRKRVQA